MPTLRRLLPLALLALAPRAGAQSYELSDFPPLLGGGVGLSESSQGWTVFDAGTVGFPASSLWGVPDDRHSPPVLLYPGDFGSLVSFDLSPDGRTVAFRLRTNRDRLYVRASDGSTPRQALNSEMITTGNVFEYAIDPTSTLVVYRADAILDGVFELFSRPLDTSAPAVRLHSNVLNGAGVTPHFRISPDGAWVVFLADSNGSGALGLYSVPIDGSAPARRLDTPRPLASVESDFVIAFDSMGVVYRADTDTDGVIELYGVRIDGSAPPFKRNAPLVSGGDVLAFHLSETSDQIVYRADQRTNDRFELFGVHAITGGVPLLLNGPMIAGGDVLDQRLSRDARTVLFRADAILDNVVELFAAPTDGSSPAVRLHPALSSGSVSLYVPSLSGTQALFVADLDGAGAQELYRAPVDGSQPPVRLAEPYSKGRRVSRIELAGDQVVYLADERAFDVQELFSVPVDGSLPPVNLNRHIATGGDVDQLAIVGNGTGVMYRARQRARATPELFFVPISGSAAPVMLNEPFARIAEEGEVFSFRLTPDGRDVLYNIFYGPSEDRRISIEGTGRPERLSDASGEDYLREVSPDGRFYVFERPSRDLYSEDLFAVRADGSAPPVQLDRGVPKVAYQSFLYSIAVSPDSNWVVFSTDQETEDVLHLYSAPLDGSRPAVRLDDVASSGEFPRLAFSPDSSRVVFVARDGGAAPLQLYSVLTDGSQPPVRLNGPLPPGGEVGGFTDTYEYQRILFAITADGSRVVYVAEQDTDDQVELYSVRIDGLGAPVKLSGTLPAAGDVRISGYFGQPFYLTPDSASVLYVADAETDETHHLYRAPIGGGSAPVKLSGTITPNGAVGGALENLFYIHSGMELSADGRWFAYMGDCSTDNLTEIYAVRVDGSAPPHKLNLPLPADQDVYDLRIDPTSNHAAWRTGSLYSGFSQWMAPIDGSAPAVELSQQAAFYDFARGYQFTADGTRLVYAVQEGARAALFVVPVAGGAAPQRVSDPSQNVGPFDGPHFEIAPDDSRVVYMADDGNFSSRTRLYAAFLGRVPRRAPPPR